MVTSAGTPADPAPLAAPGAVPVHLLGYLAQLPLCDDTTELLQSTLTQAMRLTGALAGLAGAAWATASERISEGAVRADLRAAVVRLLPTPTDDGEGTRSLSPDPAVWTEPPAGAEEGATPVVYAALPAEGDLQGVLALVLPPDRPLTAAARDTLGLVITAAGGALATQRTLARTRQRLTELSLLYEVATAMGSTLELSVLLQSMMQVTQTALRSEACTLMLLDEDRRELIFEIPLGEKQDELHRFRIPLDQGLAGWVARTGRPAIVNDLRNDPRFLAEVDASSGFLTRAALCVPLLVRGQVIGVLEVLNKQDSAPYTTNDLALLTTLAGQAAVALDNARLFRSLREEHERLLAAEEEVRKNLARDLHDGPAQDLAAISMGLEVTRRLLELDLARARRELDGVESLARRATRQIRTLQFELRPLALETRGVRAALETYIQQLNQSRATQYTLEVDGCKGRLPTPVEQATFSIVQEALGNTRKHGQATRVDVRMHERADQWTIEVSDNGQGFDVNSVLKGYENRGSLGLLNMHERAATIGGQLTIHSAPGQGTHVTLQIPCAPTPDPDPAFLPLPAVSDSGVAAP
jgi:signal transduction histidine kinase